MAFCEHCGDAVELVHESTWVGNKHADADTVTTYRCTNDDCANDGGKVWATTSGRVIAEVGVE